MFLLQCLHQRLYLVAGGLYTINNKTYLKVVEKKSKLKCELLYELLYFTDMGNWTHLHYFNARTKQVT